ncbi:MAG: family 10 glycosylhydrolase [Candidatus Galacturonibacter soehngenii]|nr:family 10 glycosylhydrolase [Candidatus Galacturonibacter soehngenii]
MNKRIIAILLMAVMIISTFSNTALASNDILEVQGSNAFSNDSLEGIETGTFTLEEEATIIENKEDNIIVEYNDTNSENPDKDANLEEHEEISEDEKSQETNESTQIDDDVNENQIPPVQNTLDDNNEVKELVTGPKAVTSLTYVAMNYKQVMISWKESEGATQYGIYRSTEKDGIYELLGKTSTTNYKSEVSCGLLYYYKVVPFKDTIQGEENVIAIVTKPDKISKLKVQLKVTDVSISWKAGKGAQVYTIYRSEKKNSAYEIVGETNKTKYTDKSTVQGKSYYYKVFAKSNGTQGEGVQTKKSIKIPKGPKAVKGLKYKRESFNSLTLSWKASTGATKYTIYRATSKNGTYKKIKTTTSTTYRLKNVKCGKIYFYKIVPYKDKLPGKEKIIKANTIPDKVTKLKATVKDNTITLTWKKAKGAVTYEIYRSNKKNSGFTKVAEIKKTKYIDKNLTYGKTYYYQVYARSNDSKGKKVVCNATIPKENTADLSKEMRAVWISYLDYGLLKDKNESDFTKNINAMYDKVLAQNANTVIVHVRAFGDAVYPSRYYRWANFITSNEDGPDYDPLEIMITQAHKKGLLFQAWINPYRTKDGGRVNPGSSSAIKKIVSGVEEIVSNYDVDGIHFDDYFYLSTDDTSQEEKMANVNKMVMQVYAKIKSIKSNVIFGISPAGNIDYAKSIGCDVDAWLSNTGYIDYICPQLYWSDDYVTRSGISTKMFTNTMKQWTSINKNNTTMYAGLALYKVGTAVETTWGSDMGWGRSTSNLYHQYKAAKNAGYLGYSLYRYESLSLPAAKEELNQLKKLSK